MSVLTIGGQRFAAGLDWQRELVKGRAAGRIAKERYRPWMVDVGEQTGFVNGVDNPEGSRPLAAVLLAGLGGAGSWAAFVEEDAKGEEPRRVAVLRGAGAVILPGGDTVFPSGEEAFAALGNLQGDQMHLVVTPGLVEFAPDAEVLGTETIAEGAASAPEMSRAPAAGMSVGSFLLLLVLMVGAGGGLLWWLAGDDLLRMVGFGPKKAKEEPLVEAVVRTGDFLRHCQAAIDARRVSMSGFNRLGVACHPRFAGAVSKVAPGSLAGQPVLEVFWTLREGLDPRVYVPLAQDMLKPWPIAFIDDEGTSAAFMALPVGGPTLTALREFRDGYMLTTPEGRRLVVEYYRTAPGIVAAIPKDHSDWEWIAGRIDEAVAAIGAGEDERALAIYTGMVRRLADKWL